MVVSKLSASYSQNEKAEFPFISKYKNLRDVLTDYKLATLGDAYVNFVYSLALSKRFNKPIGKKVASRFLANALRMAKLRELLPSRIDRHRQADAAEALIIYAWIKGIITIEECITILEKENQPDEGFNILLKTILSRIKLSRELKL